MTAQSSQFNRPPKHRNNRPAALTYAEATARATQATQSKSPPPATAAPPAATIQASSNPLIDYHEELKQITFDIENKLKAKHKAAIANLQSSVDGLKRNSNLNYNNRSRTYKQLRPTKLRKILIHANWKD